MRMLTLGDIARELSTPDDPITIRVAEHAAYKIPERGRCGILRYWDERDIPAFMEAFRKNSNRRLKFRTTTAGWVARNAGDAT